MKTRWLAAGLIFVLHSQAFGTEPASLQISGTLTGIVSALPGEPVIIPFKGSAPGTAARQLTASEFSLAYELSNNLAGATVAFDFPETTTIETADLSAAGDLVLAVTGMPLNVGLIVEDANGKRAGGKLVETQGSVWKYYGVSVADFVARGVDMARVRFIHVIVDPALAGPENLQASLGIQLRGLKHMMLNKPSQSWIERRGAGYELYWNGKPFWIMGAGGRTHLDKLARAGGNTVRLWSTDGAQPIMDNAYSNGLAVCLGLWMKHERHGFNYNDREEVENQMRQLRAAVNKYKNHPALLMWGAGNEVEWQPGTNVVIYKAINEIARMIKTEDTNHPVMCTLADLGVNNFKVGMMQRYCPDVDVLGINSYGGLRTLSDRLRNSGWTRPYVVTEFGPKGHWEVLKAPGNAPIEQSTTVKAQFAYESYKPGIQTQTNWCLGGFVFWWGYKKECTPTWFSMFMPDNTHFGLVDYMTYAWTGKWPTNRCPEILSLDCSFANKRVTMAPSYMASVGVVDPESDPLTYRWELLRETNKQNKDGSWETQQFKVPSGISASRGSQVTFKTPSGVGGYRLFVYVTDPHGNSASANFPFMVEPAAE